MSSETLQRVLPAPAVEAASKVYLEDLAKGIGAARTVDLTKLYGPQFVAPESQFTQQARALAPGLGSYQPFLQAAQAQVQAGPSAYQQYMSPYQQSVIDTTMREYDIQAQKGLPGLAASAIQQGAFGGAREGVQRAEYQSQSDRNRAALFAQLQQQGFGQAQQLAQQNLANQLQVGQAGQGFLGSQISGLTALGTQQQAQRQAELEAQKQLEFQRIYQPLQTAQQYGQGVMGLISGYPQQTQLQSTPSPSPLQTLLGTGATLAGIYRALGQGSAGFATK